MNKDKIIVKYQIQKEFCRCCNRDLDDAEIGEVREFDFYLKQLKEDVEWNLYDEECELDEVIRDYVYETIDFYAVNTYDRLILPKEELNKISEHVKNNLL